MKKIHIKNRLHSAVEYWRATGVIPRWQLVAVYVIIAIAGAIGSARTSSIANNADKTANQTAALARSNSTLLKSNRDLTIAIQDQRRNAILDGCINQNKRHRTALRVTLRLLAHPSVPSQPLTPEQKLAQRKALVEWMDALVPKRNCAKLVKGATQGP